ncbi:MAG: LLM class flavin-dependent oxidoreductase, partial [Bacteroidetes bacterium]|nr:LLM class flavin-dependent oxidoreductase [Bacteroidota bacterium]
DEIVVSTFTEKAEDRLRSYELLAELFDLQPREYATAPAVGRSGL